MRDVDRRTRVGRRSFLRGSATAVPAAALLGSAVFSADAWADAANLTPQTMATLARMARDIFPHDRLADVYYARAVADWDGKAADPAIKAIVVEGVMRLDAAAKDAHGVAYRDVPWEQDRVALLQGIEQSALFGRLRGALVVSLYNQEELWPKFGYEGSSAEYGGYIHRGFNDIDWLPQS